MLFLFLFFYPFLKAEDASVTSETTAPKQYIFAEKESEEFSQRTLNAPFTDITPHPLVLTNSAFENIFYSNTSLQAKSQGAPTVAIRGSNQAARVLYVLDDIPLNFADGFGGSNLLIPIELTQSVHVIEGPSSSLYGANAMAGAIHFKTKSHARPLLRIGYGDADKSLSSPTTTANLAIVAPIELNDTHSLRMSSFLEKDRGDFRHTTDGFDSTRSDNSQSLRRFTLSSRHKWTHWDIRTFSLYTGLNKITPGPLHTPLITSQKSDVYFAAVSAKRKTDNMLSKSVISASRMQSQFFDFGSNNSDSDKLFASHIHEFKLSNNWLSQTLLDINWNRYQSSYTGSETFDRTEPELAQTFIYDSLTGLTVEPSVRYLQRYQQLLGQVHIPYKFKNARTWISVGQGYRPPALTDLYAQTSYYIGNRDLLPEKSVQTELGLGWDLPFVSVTSSVYKTRYTNLFRSSSVSPGVISKINVGEAESSGINLGASFKLSPHWKTQWQHSMMAAREIPSNTPLLFSPSNQTFVSITYEHKKWTATAQHTMWSSFWDIDYNTGDSVKMGSWEGTDILISHTASDRVRWGVGVFNIFDNPRQLSFDFPEPQRRIFLNLEVEL